MSKTTTITLMNIKQLQVVLAEYTDHWINQQAPAERGALRTERADLEYQLAEKMAQRAAQRPLRAGMLTLGGVV
jgi:hypothetical protein